jgi:BRCT domain type II-containing protein
MESEKEMIDLEETAIAFFRAIHAAGRECLGHDQFSFTMSIETKSRKEDQESAVVLGAKIQEALTSATRAVQPVTIEGTSLQ